MSDDYPALMTSGLTEWGPPLGDRFCSYDQRDRDWMEPLGIGRQVPAALFDVRDERGGLIGYTHRSPMGDFRRQLKVNVAPEVATLLPSTGIELKPIPFRIVVMESRPFQFEGLRYLCWCADIKYAIDLIYSKIITVVGRDRISDWIYELRKRQHEYEWELRGGR